MINEETAFLHQKRRLTPVPSGKCKRKKKKKKHLGPPWFKLTLCNWLLCHRIVMDAFNSGFFVDWMRSMKRVGQCTFSWFWVFWLFLVFGLGSYRGSRSVDMCWQGAKMIFFYCLFWQWGLCLGRYHLLASPWKCVFSCIGKNKTNQMEPKFFLFLFQIW